MPISCAAHVVANASLYAQPPFQCEKRTRINHQQLCIALIALRVKVQWVDGGKVLSLVSLPGEQAVIVYVHGKLVAIGRG